MKREIGGIPAPDVGIVVNELIMTGTERFKIEKGSDGWKIIFD